MFFFIPNHGVDGPDISINEIKLDSNIGRAFELAQKIYEEEVTCFYNNSPGFRISTSEEKRIIYILARALQAYAKYNEKHNRDIRQWCLDYGIPQEFDVDDAVNIIKTFLEL